MFVQDEDEVKKYNSKQQLMDMIIHSCDFAGSARKFDTVKQGTFALFEEFFAQGDAEREKNLPISFLCDRNTTFVAKSQPGFLGFVVLPLWRSMVEVIPACKPVIDQLVENSETWKNYTETEQDKKVYTKKEKKKSINLIDKLKSMEFEGSENLSIQQHLSQSSAGEGSSITKKTELKKV